MGVYILSFIILAVLSIVNIFFVNRFFMKKAKYDCHNCKNWQCPKHYCDAHKRLENNEDHIYDTE